MPETQNKSNHLNTVRDDLNRSQFAVVTLLVAVIALLPFGRLSEIPIIVLMLWGLVLLFRRFKILTGLNAFKPLTYTFLAYLALTSISAFDSYWSEKSWLIALASLRFYLMGLVVIYYANTALLRQVLKWTTVLMVVWAVDALIQSIFGHNLLGQSSYPGRLTGVFGQNVKLGPVLALMLPLVLIQMCRYRAWVRWLVVALMVLVILLSGTRSAWLMMGFGLIMFWWHHVKGRRWLLMLKTVTLTLLAMVVLWFSSNDFQQRIDRSLVLLHADVQAIDFALADRLPIWKTAINMYVDHPINGVGARAFRQVYSQYAEPGDVWVAQAGSGLHAHHWVLELLAETGTIGLMLMLWLMVVVIRYVNTDFRSDGVWPFAVALMAAMLPVISLYSLFASFWSICLWWLLIMLIAGVKKDV
jgi:O-antigen ligase